MKVFVREQLEVKTNIFIRFPIRVEDFVEAEDN